MALLLAGIAGCGEEQIASSHPDIAKESLLTSSDMAKRAKIEGGLPPDTCGPTRIFRNNGGTFAETPMFNFNGTRVQEAVGVFPREGLAELAFETLLSRAHRGCIGNVVASWGKPQDTVNVAAPENLQIGDRGGLFRVHVIGAGSVKKGTAAVPSIRVGRCVSALILLTKDREKFASRVSNLVAKASIALAEAC